MTNKQIRMGLFEFTVAFAGNQKRASPKAPKAQLISTERDFYCSRMSVQWLLWNRFCWGCLSALQLSAAFHLGQGSSCKKDTATQKCIYSWQLSLNPLPSAGFWPWFYEPSTLYSWGATWVIGCCCPMPLLHLELNQSTTSGTNG